MASDISDLSNLVFTTMASDISDLSGIITDLSSYVYSNNGENSVFLRHSGTIIDFSSSYIDVSNLITTIDISVNRRAFIKDASIENLDISGIMELSGISDVHQYITDLSRIMMNRDISFVVLDLSATNIDISNRLTTSDISVNKHASIMDVSIINVLDVRGMNVYQTVTTLSSYTYQQIQSICGEINKNSKSFLDISVSEHAFINDASIGNLDISGIMELSGIVNVHKYITDLSQMVMDRDISFIVIDLSATNVDISNQLTTLDLSVNNHASIFDVSIINVLDVSGMNVYQTVTTLSSYTYQQIQSICGEIRNGSKSFSNLTLEDLSVNNHAFINDASIGNLDISGIIGLNEIIDVHKYITDLSQTVMNRDISFVIIDLSATNIDISNRLTTFDLSVNNHASIFDVSIINILEVSGMNVYQTVTTLSSYTYQQIQSICAELSIASKSFSDISVSEHAFINDASIGNIDISGILELSGIVDVYQYITDLSQIVANRDTSFTTLDLSVNRHASILDASIINVLEVSGIDVYKMLIDLSAEISNSKTHTITAQFDTSNAIITDLSVNAHAFIQDASIVSLSVNGIDVDQKFTLLDASSQFLLNLITNISDIDISNLDRLARDISSIDISLAAFTTLLLDHTYSSDNSNIIIGIDPSFTITLNPSLDISDISVNMHAFIRDASIGNLDVIGRLDVSGIDIYHKLTEISGHLDGHDTSITIIQNKTDYSMNDLSVNIHAFIMDASIENLDVIGRLDVSGIDVYQKIQDLILNHSKTHIYSSTTHIDASRGTIADISSNTIDSSFINIYNDRLYDNLSNSTTNITTYPSSVLNSVQSSDLTTTIFNNPTIITAINDQFIDTLSAETIFVEHLKLLNGTSIQAHSSIVPGSASSHDLGSVDHPWNNAYANTFHGKLIGNLSGNATTSTQLQTPINIGGISFNGTESINLPGVNKPGNQNTSGNAGTVTDGVYTNSNQTIGGEKTFTSTIQGNVTGNAGTVTDGIYRTSRVTELSDVTSVGSGRIITTAERTKLDGIPADAHPTNYDTVLAAEAVMKTGNQTIGGEKTFTSGIITQNNVVKSFSYLGRAVIGNVSQQSNSSDEVGFCHRNCIGYNRFALMQDSVGNTTVNGVTAINFRIGSYPYLEIQDGITSSYNHFLPAYKGKRNLGSSELKWGTVYATEINVEGVVTNGGPVLTSGGPIDTENGTIDTGSGTIITTGGMSCNTLVVEYSMYFKAGEILSNTVGSMWEIKPYSNDLYFFWWPSDNNPISQGKISHDNNSDTNMNFTGQHRCIMNNSIDLSSIGLIVETISRYINLDNDIKPTINDSLPICKIVNNEYSPLVFGVISNKEDNEREYAAGNFITPYEKTNINEKRIFINSVGEGAIWICNKNGILNNGDYITSSIVTGYGMKQTQNIGILSNFTVAKITCDCSFNLVKIPKQKVKVDISTIYYEKDVYETISKETITKEIIFDENLNRYIEKNTIKIESEKNQMYDLFNLYDESGNLIYDGSNIKQHSVPKKETLSKTEQNIVYDNNGDIMFEYDLDASGNQIMEYLFETRFLDENTNILIDEDEYNTRLSAGENVYIACFVGCTYHCG